MDKFVGENIRKLRKEKKVTLKELSSQTGLSIGFLSQIETKKSSLTLESLKKISDALGVNPSYFFKDYEDNKSFIIKSNFNDISLNHNQFIYKNLVGGNIKLPFNPFLVFLNVGENKGNPLSHDGVEFIFVLKGILTILLRDEEYHLHPHDSIVIDSNDPHYWLNKTDEPVLFLCVQALN